MDAKTFLETVQDYDGYICIAAISPTNKIKQRFFTSIDEAVAAGAALSGKYNVYVGTGRYETPNSRKAANVKSQRSIYIDIDCGENKPYAHAKDAVKALSLFIKNTGMPMPIVVDSGNGVHAYWPLNKSLSVAEWQPLAEGFKLLCAEQGLQIDTSVTADAARILRLPGTMNIKNKDNPKLCQVKAPAQKTLYPEQFAEFISHLVVETPSKTKGLFTDGQKVLSIENNRPDTVMDKLIGSFQSSFKRILEKSFKGRGCEQLKKIIIERERTEEPLWRAGLSIAKFCVDAEKAALVISEDHPNYKPKDTQEKIQQIEGPYTCDVFNKLRPGVCDGCPNRGKIKSPIALGKEMAPAPREDIAFVDDEGKKTVISAAKQSIPDYPKGYGRGKNGGIFELGFEQDEEPSLVYINDLYVIRRVLDPVLGETVMFRLHLPRDTPREFMVPATAISSNELFRAEMAKQGVSLMDYNKLRRYATAWVNDLQFKGAADNAARRFGWLPDRSAFVIGERMITATGAEPNYPTKPTAQHFNAFQTKGTLKGWKNTMLFYDKPEMALYQYVVCRAFGSVLMEFVPGIHASGMHLFSQGSGYGKTTVLFAQMTAWGNPELLVPKAADTQNLIFHRAEVMGNVPMCVDEFSNASGKQGSDFAMILTSGAQRGRLTRTAEERVSPGNWNLLFTTTGNDSFTDVVASYKGKGIAEGQRVLDVRVDLIPNLPKQDSDEFIQELMKNYGHAGPVFVNYVINNKKMVEELIMQTRERVDRVANLSGQNRFWSADITVVVVACMICKKIGLLNYSPNTLMQFAIEMVKANHRIEHSLHKTARECLSEFIYENWNNMLVIYDEKKVGMPGTNFKLPEHDARGRLVGRYVQKGNRLQVSKSEFRKWCTEYRVNYDTIEKELIEKEGAVITKQRLSSGSKINLPSITCISLRLSLDGPSEE